jgi:hypothetical protein
MMILMLTITTINTGDELESESVMVVDGERVDRVRRTGEPPGSIDVNGLAPTQE